MVNRWGFCACTMSISPPRHDAPAPTSANLFIKMSDNMRERRRQFRRNKRLHGTEGGTRRRDSESTFRERFICWVASLQVLFLAWSLGSMHLWAHVVNTTLACVAFFGLFLPGKHVLRWDSRASGIRLLPRSGVFWFGLLFVAYVGVQGFNHGWKYQEVVEEIWIDNPNAEDPLSKEEHIGWQVVPVESNGWLPSSVQMPYGRINAAMGMLPIVLPAWLWACVLTTGLERRSALRSILWAAVLGAAAMALFGIVQRLLGADKIFGWIASSNPEFFGSFIYPNHAAAFLYLVLGAAMGLAFHAHARSARRDLRSGPHYILIFLALVLLLALLLSHSKAGIVLGLSVAAFGICASFVRMLGQGSDFRQGITLGILFVCGMGFSIYAFFNFVDIGRLLMDFKTIEAGAQSISVEERVELQQATWKAFKDNHWLGTGAGSFRYYFPFVQQDAAFTMLGAGERYYEHAHSDYLQALMEYGILGCIPLCLFFMVLLLRSISAVLRRPSVHLSLLVGVGAFALHAWWDFPAQCPSVLLLVIFILAIISRWGVVDAQQQRIDNDPTG